MSEIISETDKTKTLNFVSQDGDVYILGEFDESISQNVVPHLVKRLDELSNVKDPKITFYINSNGGYCHELYNLLSLIEIAKSRGITIVTVNMGRAYSCGSLLAIVGDHRAMYKYARNLMHLGQQSSDSTTFKQIDRTCKRWKEHFENIVDMYKEHTKMSEKMIREELEDDDYFLNAEECLKYGLVDEIIGEDVEPNEIVELSLKDGDVFILNNKKFKIKVDNKKEKKETEKKEETKQVKHVKKAKKKGE